MEPKGISKAKSLDDLVFERRNKDYGAFVLRKKYEKHMLIAVLVAVALFVLLIAISIINAQKEEDETDKDVAKVISISDLAPPPPIEKIPPPPPPEFKLPPPPKKTIEFVAPKITDKVVPEEKEMPTMKEIKEAPVISTETIDLPGNITFEEPPAEIGTGDAEPKIYRFVQQMPEFPGGIKALYEFLARNTEYPESAQRKGIEGTVLVTFVVSKEGKISDIVIKRGLTEDINQEVLRVIEKMPDWRPGKQNGRAVNVQYILPYVFKMN